ncbi:MAG TPA: sigma-54 dependent transcriptional regulator [Ignavibacteria bacterium]|nr:sigma-54-dependent Fis family transcriptional regulator [Ignavibacteria bacterium]HAX48585.1 sigma-54-dependent Fis family transcriptional regulator [Bacteroidota bacterium]HRE11895.1 sigma-54 dependent transcriptional regulator [Ignavibacteria bacterium]HRF64976.1 sigma-54 dependent transcriptional regulator [Ignavibacteria bacterium]HRJ03403.1 sigma-54 dependent transcriptional regulator [Ignavibacteria bacterium]
MNNGTYQSGLLGNSIPIVELREIIKQVAPTDVTVLITGESGSGKEVVANEIHKQSKRSDKPFITVNCGAIPEGIIESELFGHVKGSFTGATENRKGYFEAANSGTIFLDEIGELPLQTQVKFLRVIENGEYMKVGGNKTERVDVRIIAATNKNLEQLIQNNSFREDLYYRLRSINIVIPPLRERKGDIKLLFDKFVAEFTGRNTIQFNGITPDAIEFITNYNWPGNVRQLKNFTESLITLNADKIIELDDVMRQLSIPKNELMPATINGYNKQDERQLLFGALFELKKDIMDIKHQLSHIEEVRSAAVPESGFYVSDDKIDNITFDEFEQELLTYYYNKYNGNINRIAEKLKISNRTLYRKFKQYGLKNGKYNL